VQLRGAKVVLDGARAGVRLRAAEAVHHRAVGAVPPQTQTGVPQSAPTKVRVRRWLWWLKCMYVGFVHIIESNGKNNLGGNQRRCGD